MIDVALLITQHHQAETDAIRARWREYRQLVELAEAGTLTAAQTRKFGAIAGELGISPEQAAAHAAALRDFASIGAKQAEVAGIDERLAGLMPRIESWAARRADEIKKLDAEGQPLLTESQQLQAQKRQLEDRIGGLTGRGEAKFPELFGLDTTPRPRPAPPTQAEMEENNRRANTFDYLTRLLALFRDGLPVAHDRKELAEEFNNCISSATIYASLPHNPRAFSPDNAGALGWQAMLDRLPMSLRGEDPRKKEVCKKVRELKRAKLGYFDCGDSGKYLLSLGKRFGWLDVDYSIPAGVADDPLAGETD